MRNRKNEKREQRQRNHDRRSKERGSLPPAGASTALSGNYKRIDLHGKHAEAAEKIIDRAMTETEPGYDGVCFIHGHHGGNTLKNLIPPIAKRWGKRVMQGTTNPGETIVFLD